MHLTRLVLTNFRGFASLDLPLDRHLTVLVGRNGSGKSSVLDAIRIVLNAAANDIVTDWVTTADVQVDATLAELDVGVRDGTEDRGLFVHLYRVPGRDAVAKQMSRGGSTPPPIAYAMDRAKPGQPLNQQRLSLHSTLPRSDIDEGAFSVFEQLVVWFRECEDLENQERVRRRNLDFAAPALEAARQAITHFLGQRYASPRIDRGDETRLLINKDGQPLSAAKLSDGERSLIVMAGDLVRRMALAHPDAPSVREAEAIVLIDEIELHLHPSWQQRIIPALRETFPNAQFILTTHSPQVLSQVPAESLRILDNFQVYSPAHPVRGRDANAILREVMGTTERPRFVLDLVARAEESIDQGKLDEASQQIEGLRGLLGSDDSEVVRLTTMLHFLDSREATSEGAAT